jgi:hypothetical protein
VGESNLANAFLLAAVFSLAAAILGLKMPGPAPVPAGQIAEGD